MRSVVHTASPFRRSNFVAFVCTQRPVRPERDRRRQQHGRDDRAVKHTPVAGLPQVALERSLLRGNREFNRRFGQLRPGAQQALARAAATHCEAAGLVQRRADLTAQGRSLLQRGRRRRGHVHQIPSQVSC